MKKSIILACMFFPSVLAGCATPSGQLSKDDFEWSEVKGDYTYQEAYRRLDTGFKKCGNPIESAIFTDNQTAYFYVYLPDMFGGKSPWVLGKIDVLSAGQSSSVVSIGVQHNYDKPVFGDSGKIRKVWVKFLDKDYSACDL